MRWVQQLSGIWASHAVMNGVPLIVVAKNLGHSDTRMVERHYGHLAPSSMAVGSPTTATFKNAGVANFPFFQGSHESHRRRNAQ